MCIRDRDYTITFAWPGEGLPLNFNAGNITVGNATEGTFTTSLTVRSDKYDFYGVYNTNDNIYYTTLINTNWTEQKGLAASQGTGSHLAVINDVNENTGGTWVVPKSHKDNRTPRGPLDKIVLTAPIPGEIQI